MAKIKDDKYYTPIFLANHCWDKTFEVIGRENITDIIEPSCGNGSFLHYDINQNISAYDIAPECDYPYVTKSDYLLTQFSYKKGRLVIGNPPYGERLYTAQKFYRKSIMIADYIAFILPISQLHNTHSLYEFDLIHSEDLGVNSFSGRKLHCCFNIYARPKTGTFNKIKKQKLKDISIYRQDSRLYDSITNYDLRMCYWGSSAGRILNDAESYAAEYKIVINNDSLRQDIIDVLTNFDFKDYVQCISAKKIYQYHIEDILRERIPQIQ